jgi:transposase-like protein
MYVNRNGFRAIERITGVNYNTIINWVKQAGLSLPYLPDREEI